MDFQTLIAPKTTPGSIAFWVNYQPFVSEAAEIVKQAQDEIFTRLRAREMRKGLSFSVAQGLAFAPLPTDYLDAVSLFNPYGCEVKRTSDDRLLARRTTDSTGALIQSVPTRYGVFDQAFQFDCAANGTLAFTGLYYGATYIGPAVAATTTTPAAAEVDTNILTQRYSHLFRAMLLKHAYAFRKDWQAAALYEAQAEKNFILVEANDDLSYRGLDDDDHGARL